MNNRKWQWSSPSTPIYENVKAEHDCANLPKMKSMVVKCPFKFQNHSHSDVLEWYKIFNYRNEKVLNCFESYVKPHIKIDLDAEYDGSLLTHYLNKIFFKLRMYYRAALTGRTYLFDCFIQYKIEEYNGKVYMIMAVPSAGCSNSKYFRKLNSAVNVKFLQNLNGCFSDNVRIIIPEPKVSVCFGEPILISLPVSHLWQQETNKPTTYCNCPDFPKIFEILQPTMSINKTYICIYKRIIKFKFFENAHPHFLQYDVSEPRSHYPQLMRAMQNTEETIIIKKYLNSDGENDVNLENDESMNSEDEKPINLVIRQEEKSTNTAEATEITSENEPKSASTSNQDVAEYKTGINIGGETNAIEVAEQDQNHVQIDSENIGDLLAMALSFPNKKNLTTKTLHLLNGQ